MRCGFAFGILTFVFLALIDTFELERHDLLRHRLLDLALEPDKGLVFILQTSAQFCHRHLQQSCQLAQLSRVALDVFRNRPDAGGRHAGSQNHTVAIQNTATIGGQLQCSGKTHFTLTQEEVIRIDLDIGGARGQSGKAQSDRSHDEFAAPDRRLAGQQGA